MLGLATVALSSQDQPAAVRERPKFEATSVKVSPSIEERSYSTLTRPGGHVAMNNMSLRQLVAQAYNFANLSQAQSGIAGMPRWGDSERFDIDAEAPGKPATEQKRLMLQSLLAERFKLIVRHETRQLPVFALEIAKSGQIGPQLRPHREDAPCQVSPRANGPLTQAGSAADAAMLALRQFPCGRIVGGLLQQGGPNPAWAGGRKVTVQAIAESLGGDEYIDRPLIDRTGLAGAYDFTIEWNTKQQDLAVTPQPDAPGLSLFEAVREQLGLKVTSGKGPAPVLVIVHVERPTGN